VSLASPDASIYWSALRGTGSVAEGVAGAAADTAVRTCGEVVACVQGVRTSWWSKGYAHEERGVGAGVSCERWRCPLLVGCARHSATGSGGGRCSRCCRCMHAWRGGHLRAGSAHLLEGQGVRSCGAGCRRRCLSRELALPSPGRLCEAQRDRQWGLQVQPLLPLYTRVAKRSPACGECALAGRARGALTRRGVSTSVALASTSAAFCLSGRLCEAHRDRQWWLLVQPPMPLYAHGARWSPACGDCELAGRARGALMRRGVLAPEFLRALAIPSRGRLYEAQRDQAVVVAGAAAAACVALGSLFAGSAHLLERQGVRSWGDG
jgi:hypothetical protein